MGTLSERIAARTQLKPTASTAARNRSVFISLRKEIQQAVTDGWSLLAIWKTLFDEGRISFTYQAFRRYARKLVDKPVSASRSEHETGETLEAAADTCAFSAKPTKGLLP